MTPKRHFEINWPLTGLNSLLLHVIVLNELNWIIAFYSYQKKMNIETGKAHPCLCDVVQAIVNLLIAEMKPQL